jgi:DEAD/DEAH box helicase/Helicase conserved C-terminal domain
VAVTETELADLRARLSSEEIVRTEGFGVLRDLWRVTAAQEDREYRQEFVLRALEKRAWFNGARQVLDSMARDLGLFPYLDSSQLSLKEQLAYELHRPDKMGAEVVFHTPQMRTYLALLDGRNVILNAPTSFGKSVITDAVLASGKYKNMFIVVPTIALIDETRRRLNLRFRDEYKVITHSFQNPAERNVYVLTQERALEVGDSAWDAMELIVIDEFYKLTPKSDDDERSARLNEVLYKSLKLSKQFYMLGPTVGGLTESLAQATQFELFSENYKTVVTQEFVVDSGENPMGALINLCRGLEDSTIVFCSSPEKATEVGNALVAAEINASTEESRRAAAWVGATYHPEWIFTRALGHGIGIHHGRIPRSLAQYVVRAFNSEHIKFLVCTSTLIEGVNTRAKNVIVFNNTIANRKIDYFTFNNIRGRSGRMLQHFVGNVYLFNAAPQPILPVVDVPAISQSEKASKALLLHLEEEDLSLVSRERLKEILGQQRLSLGTLRRNNVDPELQLSIASEIEADLKQWLPKLQWKQIPLWDQLEAVCILLWKYFDGGQKAHHSVSSPRQLAYLIKFLRQKTPTMRELIDHQNKPPFSKSTDEAVEKMLDFTRLWANIHFPRYLRVLNLIQQEILTRHKMTPGDYDLFAAQVEHLFLDPVLIALEEYGIPVEVGRKIQKELLVAGDLDSTLRNLRTIKVTHLAIDDFEKSLIEDAREYV